ncbi:Rnd efflux pump, membrane fusion protein, czcb subfamily [Pseudomonas syringae pv. delphinii]|uniref:Rnd efflux pump, membrane fusion protein, czcb subfamily n=1 Tax=Pseudomonas syringae pv. delphinii TaxID=192088 RepID=A0A0P9TVJ9_9PSED|nr:efflux RND transporter periplasmic adaptor subunit [Pseudomonas syringae group genomosp. 3]KPX17304.1 Rnd efflux pump, membrane fusion protein, czcb subfamily [Pseudomonas syringae pv. delphinii]RMP11242.1 Rnd efflux pump, membrane fusion protein, czcb subfamily [Pseudomonas syringae pv. delphinii]RMP26750.1 Rnd efflux pump, membrane fusion protein, czcb subfamily [Pseudomonas syringae pv. delphinii]RMQ29519.1 Rnd efflux pump, membrane fusion protein, czcb subfamily [Pseudomonas syringae pv.
MQLPGRIEAWSRAPLYARVSGYLKRWDTDIGSAVKAGQLLAEIDAPDLDQQLRQARAELATSRSEVALASTTAKRWELLRESEAVALQDVEERLGDLTTKRSRVNEAQANVDRLQALQHYTRIVAPFDGIVTARNTDVGALINVGTASGSELFVVSDVSRLRVYVSVPQRQLAWVKAGARASLSVPEHPGKIFDATVQLLAQAVDMESGAMRVQLSVDNESDRLLPGSFATVQFAGARVPTTLSLPPGALIVGKGGVQVATVDGAGTVQLKQVQVARDHDTYIELVDGAVSQADRVIANPPDGLATGDQVRIAQANTAAAK